MKSKFYISFCFFGLLYSCSEKLPEKIIFFENYELSNGNYKILIYGTEGQWIDDYRDFYIDDIETLKNIKKQWVFTHKSEIMPCGYGYNFYLVDSEKALEQRSINIDCEYMSGWIKFPKKYLTKHKSVFKRMTEDDKTLFKEKYFQK